MPQTYIERILRARVYDVARESPLDRAATLSMRLHNNVFLKREDLQPVFSFKLRGAYNKIINLPQKVRAKGVIEKCWHTSRMRTKSCFPDSVASVTINAASTPVRDAITGQPIPGEPSMISHCRSSFSRYSCAVFLTFVTSFPLFDSAILSRACTIGPNRVLDLKSRPISFSRMPIASTGHTLLHSGSAH